MAKAWFMELIEQHDPDFAGQVQNNHEFIMQDGAIPARYKVLMTLLADALLGHSEGVKSLAGQARRLGAGEDEINETLRVAYDCGGMPALITGLSAYPE